MTPQRGKRSAARSGTDFDQLLLQAALLLVVAILAAAIYLIYYVISHEGMPSTYGDKVIQDARNTYLATPQDGAKVAAYARALTAEGKYSQSLQVIEEFRTIEATSPAPLVTVEEARVAWKQGEPESALLLLDSADAECAELLAQREAEYRKKGVSITPKMPEVIDAALLRADIQEQESRLPEAITALSVALEEDPTMADILTRRGDLYRDSSQADAARADYERALQMIPDYQPALEGLEKLDG